MSGWGLGVWCEPLWPRRCWCSILARNCRHRRRREACMAPPGLAPAQLAPGTGRPDRRSPFPPRRRRVAQPLAQSAPMVPAGRVALAVAARYGRDAPLISGGLIWRVYAANPDVNGMFRLVKEDRAATPTFMLPPGNYVVHASFGLASAAQGRAAARRHRPRGFRYSRRRRAAARPGQRRAHSHRPDRVRDLSRQPVRYLRAPADRAERDDRRCRAACRKGPITSSRPMAT